MPGEVIQNLNRLLGKFQDLARRLAGEPAVVVGYTQSYAARVHEDLQAFHPNGQAKFLEQPARENGRAYSQICQQELRRGRTLEQALLVAGLTLQRDSQLLVPVDTGALRASAFTRLEA